jgi:hypothetical protein
MFDYGASMYTDIVIGLILAASVDDGEVFSLLGFLGTALLTP